MPNTSTYANSVTTSLNAKKKKFRKIHKQLEKNSSSTEKKQLIKK